MQQKLWEVKSERDSRIAELENEVNELQQLLTESEQAVKVASRERHDNKQLLEETIRQLTYSLEKVCKSFVYLYLAILANINIKFACMCR